MGNLLKGQVLVSPNLAITKTTRVRRTPGGLYLPEEGGWPRLSW